ncbi:50S ribosomal protein L19 [Patescibacteria group bacterium]
MEGENIKISPVNMDERKKLGVKSGDTVRVWVKIQEKDKVRLQAFEGLVLAVKHGAEAGSTFTVRKVSNGVGIERIFPLYSPIIDKIEIIKRAKVRRSKLYYIREKVAREIRRQMRRMKMSNISTTSDIEEASRIKKEEEAKTKAEEEAKQKVEEEAKAKEDEKVEEKVAEAPKEEEKPTETEEDKK